MQAPDEAQLLEETGLAERRSTGEIARTAHLSARAPVPRARGTMTGGAEGQADMRAAIVTLLLSIAVPGQEPGQPPIETEAFRKLHVRFTDVMQRITELTRIESRSDAEERELERNRRQLKELSMEMMKMLVPPKPKVELPPAPERPLPREEEELRRAAHRIAMAVFKEETLPALRAEAKSMRYAETIALDHPALAAIENYRFYLARLLLQPLSGPYERHCYRLVVFDRRRRTVDFGYARGPCTVIESLLQKGGIDAPSLDVARQLPVARAFLWRASMGANVFRKPGTSGLSRAELDKRFGLGRYLEEHATPRSRVVEGTMERSVVTWRFAAHDFGMEALLMLDIWRFDKKTGRWLGAKTHRSKHFPPGTELADPKVVAVVDAFARALAKS